MRHLKNLLVLTTSVAAVVALTALPAEAAGTADRTWGKCGSGNTCLFDGRYGRYKFWTAPDCGFYDLSKMRPRLDDRLSSIRNRSDARVVLFDWDSTTGWNHVRTISPWKKANLRPHENNRVDAIEIDC
ncbi:hypothetical protein [Nonomuraea cavernae]|uniref:Peptidase inhibitor family I36 n=1 Tax=Nonomuraea cavernae TaxID=2045107 RepID=A0A917Z495_9ACTN|nr:hypothetical protein [Nonomuraea cavernae]MCA2188003.1 DUF4471 domain-containing protein [Nonomuraea cavernae]GGO72517.1 hypothetical protein GCM10012289_40700 [Nonomuraea cavernae]